MNAETRVGEARQLSIKLWLTDDHIPYSARFVTPPDLLENAREHKAEVMEYLRREDWLSISVPNSDSVDEALHILRPYLSPYLQKLDCCGAIKGQTKVRKMTKLKQPFEEVSNKWTIIPRIV